jgi:hypothetical protein
MSRRPKTAHRRWHHWTETEAKAVLDDFATSGLTPTEFCSRRGISRGRLAYWRERLPAAPTAPTPAFVEVIQSIPSRSEAHIEITRGGVVLRVREDIDVDHLARLVAALAGTSSC